MQSKHWVSSKDCDSAKLELYTAHRSICRCRQLPVRHTLKRTRATIVLCGGCEQATCVRLYFTAAPEAGLAQAHSMCGNGDVCVVAAVSLQQVCIVLQATYTTVASAVMVMVGCVSHRVP